MRKASVGVLVSGESGIDAASDSIKRVRFGLLVDSPVRMVPVSVTVLTRSRLVGVRRGEPECGFQAPPQHLGSGLA